MKAISRTLPEYKKTYTRDHVLSASQNERQVVIGTGDFSLYTPYDIKNLCDVVTPSANVDKKILLVKGILHYKLTNLNPNDCYITFYSFTPRNNFLSAKSPQDLYEQGLTDKGITDTKGLNVTPYMSSQLTRMFYIKNMGYKILKQGDTWNKSFTSKPNKQFNLNDLTIPGSTSYTQVVDQQWFKGLTKFWGYTYHGGPHEVVTAGTGTNAKTGMGYGPCRIGVLVQKTYQTKVVNSTANLISMDDDTEIGLAGTNGYAKIQNRDTGIDVYTINDGVSVNEA